MKEMHVSRQEEATEKENASILESKTVTRREFLKMAGLAGAALGLGAGLGGLVAACGTETATTTTAAGTSSTTAAAETTVTTASASSTSAGAPALDAFNTKMADVWAKAIAPVDTTTILPKTTLKGLPGKKIVDIPIVMSADSCVQITATHKLACDMLGWDYTLIDPAGDPLKISDAIDKSISMKADGVLLFAIDPTTIPEPLERLRKAGIPVGGCSCFGPNGEVLLDFDSVPEGQWVKEGYVEAVAGYHFGDGHLKAITMSIEDGVYSRLRIKGMEEFVAEAKAAGADVEILGQYKFLVSELATTAGPLAVQAVRKNPEYTAILCGADSAGDFARAGIESAGLGDNSKAIIGNDGTASFVESIRQEGMAKATNGCPIFHYGFADVDDINRMLSGEKPLGGQRLAGGPWYYDVPEMLVIAENAPEGTGAWDAFMLPSLEEGYKQLWGV